MRQEILLHQRPELRLQLSPQLIQRIEILQLGAEELEETMENEVLSNELLRAEQPPAQTQDAGEAAHQQQVADGVAAENGPVDSEARTSLDELAYADRLAHLPPARVRRDDRDPKQEALNNSPERPEGLVEHLETQLRLETDDERLRELAAYLVRSLDRNGWLTEPLAELLIPFEGYTLEDGEEALAIIQRLDPTGVGARSPQECLLLQLDPEHPEAALLRRLIDGGLEDVAANRLPKLARDLGVPLDKVKELIQTLRTEFDPFPGSRFEHAPQRRVRPDVVVEKVDDRYEVQLEDDYLPRLRIDDARWRSLRTQARDGELKRQLRRDLESARWLIESIEQRKRTLERVANVIVERQLDFLEHGVNYLKPLKMQEVADELGIHVSTVSRALKGKYMQTPHGVHEMKFFFTGASQGTDGVVESRTGVRERVREIVEREDKSHPLSDEEIVNRLATMGLKIARRTVTKYRKALGIPSSRRRREY